MLQQMCSFCSICFDLEFYVFARPGTGRTMKSPSTLSTFDRYLGSYTTPAPTIPTRMFTFFFGDKFRCQHTTRKDRFSPH